VRGLELLLQERLNKIDELNGKLQQSREQVRRLGLENEPLVAMIAAPELSMTSEQAQAQSQA
jgi:regulator of replication initiation timing